MDKVSFKNIDIALESYDDLYSDFDISHYAKRELSEDFVKELIKRTSGEHDTKTLQITLSIPSAKRDIPAERTIIRRIKQHFAKRAESYSLEIQNHQRRGIKYIFVGALIILADVFIPKDAFPLLGAIFSVLMVAGWFGVWTGIAKILDEPAGMIAQKKIYSNLASAHYVFVNEEDIVMLKQAESTEMLLKEPPRPQAP
ncbi:MAG: hypothetical protein N3G76_00780 [Candidatus Micrarchaeota archaeon]|nr:hypothetical protein [Candidatus Micrarchaeota archaeon]